VNKDFKGWEGIHLKLVSKLNMFLRQRVTVIENINMLCVIDTPMG